ncbi:MAG: helix-turn-helix domain-containing protein [Spirochaetia bacterium]|jgi:putative transcriptional regulator
MAKAYESIIRGLGEIEAHKKGKIKLRTTVLIIEPTPRYDAKAVKRIRQSLKLPQRAFARLCGVSQKTVEAWESGRNVPNGSARRLFELIEKDQEILTREGVLVAP